MAAELKVGTVFRVPEHRFGSHRFHVIHKSEWRGAWIVAELRECGGFGGTAQALDERGFVRDEWVRWIATTGEELEAQRSRGFVYEPPDSTWLLGETIIVRHVDLFSLPLRVRLLIYRSGRPRNSYIVLIYKAPHAFRRLLNDASQCARKLNDEPSYADTPGPVSEGLARTLHPGIDVAGLYIWDGFVTGDDWSGRLYPAAVCVREFGKGRAFTDQYHAAESDDDLWNALQEVST